MDSSGDDTNEQESVNLFAADKTSPHLGYLNCEDNRILCSVLSVGPSNVWYVQVPAALPSGERAPTPLYALYQNVTTVTAEDIYKVHSEKKYAGVEPYEGAFHPTDGWLAQTGLLVPLGYVLFGLSVVPSWLFMIMISMFSRFFVYVPPALVSKLKSYLAC